MRSETALMVHISVQQWPQGNKDNAELSSGQVSVLQWPNQSPDLNPISVERPEDRHHPVWGWILWGSIESRLGAERLNSYVNEMIQFLILIHFQQFLLLVWVIVCKLIHSHFISFELNLHHNVLKEWRGLNSVWGDCSVFPDNVHPSLRPPSALACCEVSLPSVWSSASGTQLNQTEITSVTGIDRWYSTTHI